MFAAAAQSLHEAIGRIQHVPTVPSNSPSSAATESHTSQSHTLSTSTTLIMHIMAEQPVSSAASSTASSPPLLSLSSRWVVSSDGIRPAKPVLVHELLTLAHTNPTHLTNKPVRLIAPLLSYDAQTDTATLGPAGGQSVAVWLGLMGSGWRCRVGAWCQVIGECEWDEAGGLVVRARLVRELGADWDMKLYEAVLTNRRAWEKRLSDEQQQAMHQQR